MVFLLNYGFTKEEIEDLKKRYNEKILSSILYKKDNVCLVIDYLENKGFDIKYLLINRLDIFLIDLDNFKNKIDKLNEEELDILKENFSLFN